MKRIIKLLFAFAIILTNALNLSAQLIPAADNNSYYYIQFRHNATLNAAMEDMGDGIVMKAQTRTLGKDAQLWRVTAGVTQGSYVFTSKLGNKIVWDSGTSRYKTSSIGTGAEIKLLYSNNATYTKSFELQRVGSTQAFNVFSGVAINNDIAEYTVGDAGGTVIFVRAPEISSIDNSAERWYWLKNYRDNGKTVNTSNVGANFNPSSPATFRKFKVVKDAANPTYGLVYLDGSNYTYLQTGTDTQDPAPFSTTAQTAFSAFTPTATAAGIRGWRIFRPGSSSGMFHMKVAAGNYSLRYNNTGVEDANVWSFFDAKDVLGENYAEVFAFYNQTVESNNPGEYSASARAALKTALDASLALYNNPAALESELLTQSANLTTAFNTYKAAVNLIKASDGTNTYWYQIRDKRSPAVYWNIATVGSTANALNRTTTSNPTANTQLFKFAQAPNPAIGYYIYSKTNETTALSAPATTDGSIISINAAQTATSWKFETASPGYFLVMTETGSRQLNSYGDKISFHQGGIADLGNNWKLVELDLTVLKNTFTQKRTEARALHTKTANYEGTDFGQYSAASRSTFNGEITTEEAKDAETLSFNQLEEGINTLQSAIDTFKATINNTLTTLLPISSENYRWYRIKSTATNAYAVGKVISAGTRVVGDKFTFETIADPVTDAQLFRFVLNNDNSKILHIINKKDGKFMASNGAIANTSTASNEFALNLLNDGVSYNIKPTTPAALHAQESGAHIVNWAGVEGSASAWVLEYVTETAAPTVTVTVVSANATYGSAVINGTSNVSATSADPIAVLATPSSAEYYFVNWTDANGGALVSTSNPYSYTGTADIELVANFATNGIPVAPMASTTEHPAYYMIQSASNGTHSFSSYTGDFRGNVLISPTAAGKIIHNKLSTATSTDHALWQIVNVEGVQLLKNKATGFYMTGSHSVGATGASANAFTFDLINGSTTQYKLRTADASGSYTNTWQNNLADRLSTGDQANSLIAWYFIAPAFTGASDFSNTTDWTNGVAPTENMAVAINSDATVSADRAFSGLHIAAGKTLTVNAGKALTIHNSITGSGTLVLKSDATSGTATVTGNVTGTATVEQYLPAGAERTWWYLASPVTGAASDVFGTNQVGEYSETNRSYSSPFASATTLTAGKGYVVKMNAAQADNVYQFANKALNNGNISVPLTRTVSETLNNKRGFNLVGNPYPSYLNWELAHKASSNVRSTIWYRTKGASAMEFHTYNAALGVSVPTAASGYIPPMQAFWVKVNTDPVSPATVSNGTINFTNAMRSHAIQGTTTPLKAPAANSLSLLRMALSNGSTIDEAVIAMHENASANFDQYDSEKMSNAGISEIFTLAGTQELVINAIPKSGASKVLQLGIRPATAGNLNFSISELKNMDNMLIILHDHTLKTETELRLNQSYNFTTESTTTTDRFSIEFRAPGMTTGLDNSDFADFNITVYSGKIQIQSPAMANGEPIGVYSSNGQKIIEQTAKGNNTIIDHKLSSGIYFVKVSNYVQKIIIH